MITHTECVFHMGVTDVDNLTVKISKMMTPSKEVLDHLSKRGVNIPHSSAMVLENILDDVVCLLRSEPISSRLSNILSSIYGPAHHKQMGNELLDIHIKLLYEYYHDIRNSSKESPATIVDYAVSKSSGSVRIYSISYSDVLMDRYPEWLL